MDEATQQALEAAAEGIERLLAVYPLGGSPTPPDQAVRDLRDDAWPKIRALLHADQQSELDARSEDNRVYTVTYRGVAIGTVVTVSDPYDVRFKDFRTQGRTFSLLRDAMEWLLDRYLKSNQQSQWKR